MDVNVIIRGTAEQVRDAMRALLNDPSNPDVVRLDVTETPIPAEEPAPAPAPKKGRPKKAEPVAEATLEPAPEPEPVETVPEAEPVADVTLDNVKDAIRALMLKTDEDTTWGVLKSVGVKGASDAFNSGKGPKLIEKCQEKIAEVEAA